MTPSVLTTFTDWIFDTGQATAWTMFQTWIVQLDTMSGLVDARRAPSTILSFDPPYFEIAASPATPTGCTMYSLTKAKTEIDTIARHATDLAAYVLASGRDVDAKLERFKADILNLIDAKFADLEHQILGGDAHNLQTSAVDDLGAKISLLVQGHAEQIAQPAQQIAYVDHQNNYHTPSYSDNNWQTSNHYN